MGLKAALRFCVWMRQLLSEIGLSKLTQDPFVVYGDNIQANNLCKNHFVSTGNQHIFMPYHWNRRVVKEGHAVVKWVQTKFNISDLMTKPLEGHTFQSFLSILCGYGSINEHLEMLETCTKIHTEKAKWTLDMRGSVATTRYCTCNLRVQEMNGLSTGTVWNCPVPNTVGIEVIILRWWTASTVHLISHFYSTSNLYSYVNWPTTALVQ